MSLYEISSAELRQFVDPLDGKMWRCDPISEAEVLAAISHGVHEPMGWEEAMSKIQTLEEARNFHINRIATLFGMEMETPALMLINHEEEIKGHIFDGNHRVAAAYIRKDPTIRIIVAASEPSKVNITFPSAVLVSA